MSDEDELQSPYPWFGGKRRAAAEIWARLGPDIVNFIDPFFGSGSILLARPGGAGKIETVNDLNCDVENFWRAIKYAPEEVAHFADYPVNEAAMHARHEWLVENLYEHRERMHTNCFYYDAERAGWWVWGQCIWIGAGWCTQPKNRKHPKLDGIGKGIHSNRGHRPSSHWRQRPHMSGTHRGNGIHGLKQQLPDLALGPRVQNSGRGIAKLKQQIPNLRVTDGAAGNGIVSSGLLSDHLHNLPSLGNDRGLNGVSAPPALEWFLALQARMRRVRVACGDWKRVLGPSILGKGKNVGGRRPCGIVFDPPYKEELRARGLYADETEGVSAEVAEWCREHGDDPELRIALCGYEGEHEMPSSWSVYSWKGARGYAGDDNTNRKLERIWFSPHCLKQATLTHLWEQR
jgi:DNA adenine methylase